MKKHLLIAFCIQLSVYASAQTIQGGKVNTESAKLAAKLDTAKKAEGWTVRGTNTLLLNQAAFSNWVSGGINSVALTGRIDYEFNLKSGKNLWENRILMGYGLRSEEGNQATKVEDVIDLTSKYGYQLGTSNWYTAAALNLKTQFAKGYDYGNPNQGYISNFMAPGYVTLGVGLDYIPNDNFQLSIHPLTSRFTIIADKAVFDPDHDGILTDAFGAKPTESLVYQLGAYIGGRYKAKLMENILLDNRFGVFSNYLKKPQNMVLSYSAILDMKVNKFISTQVTADLFYDDNQIGKLQLKETLGVGITYKFGKY
ncbi:DUF3078 domain-containing protein [Pedobacter montanisoli]|uniref:DUF3078 domain-containing protein n=1 Tax=Pedobacter montanisoli TaxID=2923277 RepID=A0ABS9ZWY7_9SPHI|nr:DUF3078 domain-containing protein [Pedobacter montanisoli]MCJ0742839.1 DUF3078 domain-containing protein [Pedobacter montanisoli]